MTRAKVAPMPFVAFCETVLRLPLTPAWRALLRVAVDRLEPDALEGEEREVARRLFGDADAIPDVARRTLVWRLGRGSGKTTIAAALAIWIMWTADLSTIGPGQIPTAVVVAPRGRTSAISVRVARELVRRSPLEHYVDKKSDTSEGFTMTRADRRRVAFMSVAASRGGATLRGFDILVLILDESEQFLSNDDVAAADGYAVSDRDMYAAASPRLHGPCILLSTPWPVPTLTSDLFDRNHGHPTTALAALGDSLTMRPDDKRLPDAIAAMMSTDQENAEREYFCRCDVRGGSRLFAPDMIDVAVDASRPLVITAKPGARVGAGGDLGLERDSSAIAVVGVLADVYEPLEFDEIRPSKGAPLAPGYVIRDRFAPVMQRHGARVVALDAHYRQSAIEHLRAVGLSMTDAPTGAQGKYDVYMLTRGLLHAGKLRGLPNSARLIGQMKNVTVAPMPGGGTRITSPRRAGQGHGDIVSAMVLAIWEAHQASKRPTRAAAPPPVEASPPFFERAPSVRDFYDDSTINMPDLAALLARNLPR